MKKKVLALFLAGMMTVTMLAGCGSKNEDAGSPAGTTQSEQQEEKEEEQLNTAGEIMAETDSEVEAAQAGEVSTAISYDVSNLAPWSSATSGRLSLMQTLYEYLAYYDSESDTGLSGILMKECERIDDFTMRVTIYDTIYDSAGNHLTAQDVAFCFNTWAEMGNSVKCKLLDSCSVVDEYTVDIKLNTDSVGDIENMMCGLVPIVTQAAYESSDDEMIEHVVSTSPYIVTDYVEGSTLTVEKNENYWQKDESLISPFSLANADKITFHIVTEASQVSTNLETNVVDIAANMSSAEVARFEADDNYNVFAIAGSNFHWITFNCSEGGLFYNNPEFRKAICYAIDAGGIVEGVFNGGAKVSKAYGNPECVDYNRAWDSEEYYEYNIEKAKELLASSGTDTSQVIRIMYPQTSVNKSMAQIIQSYLLEIGLNCELLGYESALYQTYKTEAGEWDIILDEKQSVDYVTSLASTLQVSGSTPAICLVKDEKLQELVSLVQSNEGHTEENINTYMGYIKDECYVYAICQANIYHVTESSINGIVTNFKGWLLPGCAVYTEDFER